MKNIKIRNKINQEPGERRRQCGGKLKLIRSLLTKKKSAYIIISVVTEWFLKLLNLLKEINETSYYNN